MKHHSSAILIVCLALLTWLSTFWITRTRAISRWEQDNPAWLSNVSDELQQREEQFTQQISQYIEQLNAGRVELSRLLDDPDTPEQDILDRADANTQIHTEILLAVGEHLKTMDTTLPTSQKTLLKQFCRQAIGSGMQQRNRYGRQGQPGYMRQGSGEYGNGLRQRRRRGRCGLVLRLQLTDDQLAIAAQKDPTFEADVRQIQDQLLTEKQALCRLLENEQSLNGQLVPQIERFSAACNLLEKRLVRYVVAMRPYFTPEQQKQLIGLCARQHACADPQSCLSEME